MKNTALLVFILSFLLVSCGDDSGSSAGDLSEEAEKAINTTISGMAQGPFEEGATVSVYELDSNFQKTGYNIETEITNEHGEYSINVKNFKSQYVLLKADGKLHDIFTSEKTSGKTTLYALADLGNTKKTNINILTHLAHKRALYLVTKKNMTVTKAQKQAETEVLKSFSINDDLGAAEDIDIFTDTKQNWPILSISALMQSDLLNRGVKDFLADYVSDIEKDGTWDDKKTITKIADWAYETSKKSWSDLEYKISIDTSAIKKHMNKFWQQNYGLGNCTNKQNNVVKKNNNPASNEANTFFICKSTDWATARTVEVNKYYYTDTLYTDTTASDGDIYWDKKYSVCYVYEDSVWHKINKTICKTGLSGCTKLRKNEAEQNNSKLWNICDGKEWLDMDNCFLDSTELWEKGLLFEKDTLDWKDTTDGTIRKGNKSDVIYIFDNKKWRVATLIEASLGKCSKKNVGAFGYVEDRNNCQSSPLSRAYGVHGAYHGPEFGNYGICQNDGSNNFYWNLIDDGSLNKYICNDSSYYTSNKAGDAHWGSIESIKKNCINCKQEDFDFLENLCKKRCYVLDGESPFYSSTDKTSNGWRIGNVTECALGFGGCTESRLGTINEGPLIKLKNDYEYAGDVNDKAYLSATSIDSAKKTTYICRTHYSNPYSSEYSFPPRWYIASDIDIELAPKLCDTWRNSKGVLIPGKNNNKYVCDYGGFRIATQEEIDAGIACTEYIRNTGITECDDKLEKETGMACTEYMQHVEKCHTKQKE